MTPDNDSSGMKSTTSLTRRLTASRAIDAPPERVYRAFVDPDALAEWMHPPGVDAEVHHLEPEVGGTYRVTMRGGPGGHEHDYTGTYRELVPGERIVQVETFESADPGTAGEITVTVAFDAVDDGTEVTVHLDLPAAWPDDAIAGWEAALANLAGLLEAA